MPYAKAMDATSILVDKLTVAKGKTTILDALTVSVQPGRITGLIGPSGSGKTTLMRTLVGAQKITSGSVSLLGLPAGHKHLRSQIGYVTQSPAVYDDLTVWQNLQYFAAVVGVGKEECRQAMQRVRLQDHSGQLTGALSGGERARVSLAVALLRDNPILIFDEPTVGLDPLLRHSLWQLFGELASSGKTMLVSSHVMDEAERCQDILLLRNGTVLSYGSKADLLERTRTKGVEDAFLALIKEAEK